MCEDQILMYHLNYNAMKNNFFKVFLPIILMIVIASCTGIRVSTDFDHKADFKKYKTYNFSKEVDKITSLNDMNRRRLKDAISKEMETKGFQLSTTPDILVNAFVKGQTKYTANANTTSFGGPFMYRGWGNSNTYVDVNKSVEGTLFIDLIDVSEKKMIWEGIAEGLVNPRTNTREDKLNIVVQDIFKNFPR